MTSVISQTRVASQHVLIWTVALLIVSASSGPSARTSAEQANVAKPANLKIVVVAGEDAVNIIQQKTAVAPIVEVRDRNDQPVAGALVRFAIQGGRASFGGARTLTVATDIAGRAVATGLTPTASGALQISASAAFQGQTAAVTIAQTNVLTAAQAAAVSSAGGASGGTTAGAGAAGAGGGGLSMTTLGIIGGAVAGGAVVATKALGGSGSVSSYSGPFRIEALQLNHQTNNGTFSLTCTATVAYIGTLTVEFQDQANATVTGDIQTQFTASELSRTCPFSSVTTENLGQRSDVTGTASNLQSSIQTTSPDGVGISAQSFAGVLSGSSITGTLTMSYSYRTIPTANGFFSDGTFPATSAAVTLQKK